MLFSLIGSFAIGLVSTPIYFKFKGKPLIIKKYHSHHTFQGLLCIFLSVILLIKGMVFGIFTFGFGSGLITHHWFSEKNLRLIEKISYEV